MKGDWGDYDIEYEGFRGVTQGKIAISGEPGNLTGNYMMGGDAVPSELKEISVLGDQLTFVWPAGRFGDFKAITTIDGNNMTGTITIRDREMAESMLRAGADRIGASASIQIVRAPGQAAS